MEPLTDNRLRSLLIERIEKQGALTFADFMASCLYEPGLGYYTSSGRKVGAEGDFYTSSNVHAAFGRVIAREIAQMWRSMGEPADFQIVEPGAANGRLAADILDGLSELAPELYHSLTYRLIEAEPSLAASQQKLLAGHMPHLAWNSPDDLAAGNMAFNGCLISNELVDALPVHIVEMTPSGMQELHVTFEDGEFSEQLSPLSTPELASYLERIGVTLQEGQRAEIHLAADEWLKGVARSLRKGFVITIDYGYLAPELYGPMRQNGTLLCYYHHTVEDNPYIRVGLQDMTSHVDFSSLMKTGEEAGLNTIWYGEQYRFLMAAGIMEEVMAFEERGGSQEELLKNRLNLKKLILPDGGMGDTFKVLIQAKGIADPRILANSDWMAKL